LLAILARQRFFPSSLLLIRNAAASQMRR